MSLKKLNKIIPIVALAVTWLWGMLGNAWNISWIAVPIGGVLMGIVHVLDGKDDDSKKE